MRVLNLCGREDSEEARTWKQQLADSVKKQRKALAHVSKRGGGCLVPSCITLHLTLLETAMHCLPDPKAWRKTIREITMLGTGELANIAYLARKCLPASCSSLLVLTHAFDVD